MHLLQALDLKSWTWSKVEVKEGSEASPTALTPCAGHSLVSIIVLSKSFKKSTTNMVLAFCGVYYLFSDTTFLSFVYLDSMGRK